MHLFAFFIWCKLFPYGQLDDAQDEPKPQKGEAQWQLLRLQPLHKTQPDDGRGHANQITNRSPHIIQ